MVYVIPFMHSGFEYVLKIMTSEGIAIEGNNFFRFRRKNCLRSLDFEGHNEQSLPHSFRLNFWQISKEFVHLKDAIPCRKLSHSHRHSKSVTTAPKTFENHLII